MRLALIILLLINIVGAAFLFFGKQSVSSLSYLKKNSTVQTVPFNDDKLKLVTIEGGTSSGVLSVSDSGSAPSVLGSSDTSSGAVSLSDTSGSVSSASVLSGAASLSGAVLANSAVKNPSLALEEKRFVSSGAVLQENSKQFQLSEDKVAAVTLGHNKQQALLASTGAVTESSDTEGSQSCLHVLGLLHDEKERLHRWVERHASGAVLHVGQSVPKKSAGWWVLIPSLGNAVQSEKRLADVRRLGMRESYIVRPTGERYLGISLGLFHDEQAARRYLDFVRQRGIKDAVLLPRRVLGSRKAIYALMIKQLSSSQRKQLSEMVRSRFMNAEIKSCTGVSVEPSERRRKNHRVD